jgi:hypothetical protein
MRVAPFRVVYVVVVVLFMVVVFIVKNAGEVGCDHGAAEVSSRLG